MTIYGQPRNKYLKWDKLVFLTLGNDEAFCAMEGQKVTRGKIPVDITVEEITKEQFDKVIDKAKHDNDWFSILCGQAAKQGLTD